MGQIAQSAEVEAGPLAGQDVAHEVVLRRNRDTIRRLEYLAQQSRPAPAGTADENGLRLGPVALVERRQWEPRSPVPNTLGGRRYHAPPGDCEKEKAILLARNNQMARNNLLARNDVRLFLTSLAILFVELMLIRWIPANVKYIGFFSNFLLIASFLGIGLGIILGRRGWNPRLMPFTFLLLIVTFLILELKLDVQIRSGDELFFGLAESSAADLNFLILPLVAGLVVALTASLALPLGPLLKSMPPLRAYAIDIIGSMVGIAAFTVLSASGTSPVVWFTVAAVLVFALVLGRGISRYTLLNGAVLASIVLVVV